MKHNDYDRIADRLEDVIYGIINAMRETPAELEESDCQAVSSKEILDVIRKAGDLHKWVEGLADSHRKFQVPVDVTASSEGVRPGSLVFIDEICSVNRAQSKPPIGLSPRKIFLECRLDQINAAISRYNASGKVIPSEWIREKNEIEKQLHELC